MELLTDKVIYHVETQEDYDDLMRRLDKLGCEWYDGVYTSVNYFPDYEENTAIGVEDKKIGCSPLSYYIDNFKILYKDHQIIKYKREQNSMKVKLKADQRFIADWYEEHRDDLEYAIYHEHANLNEIEDTEVIADEFLSWMNEGKNEPIQTLVKMKLFGYELEEEPLYYVELPNPNYESKVKKYYLARTVDGRIVIQSGNTAEIKENWKLTESAIKKDFAWAWEFAKEV